MELLDVSSIKLNRAMLKLCGLELHPMGGSRPKSNDNLSTRPNVNSNSSTCYIRHNLRIIEVN